MNRNQVALPESSRHPAISLIGGPADPPVHHVEFKAMGCQMAAWVASADTGAATARLVSVWALMQSVEAALSRFRPESDLSRLNAGAGMPVPVSRFLWEVLAFALDGARRSGGVYDPTVLEALVRAGYDRPFDLMDKDRADSVSFGSGIAAKERVSWRDIVMDPVARTVKLPPGVGIDLGGIAKGWAADRAAETLESLGPCFVDAGEDIAVRGAPPGLPGWPIGVLDPLHHGQDITAMMARDAGVGTSGVGYRRWRRGGVECHHAIDPATGRPADTDLLSATVIAPAAREADLQALVVLVLGSERGLNYLETVPGAEALVVRQDGSVITTLGFVKYLAR